MKKQVHSSYHIQNTTIWLHDQVKEHVDLLVEEGIVTGIEPHSTPKHSSHRIDGSRLVLIPAGVDPQVHLRVPGQMKKETQESGLNAAIQGGIGCILTMPNTSPVIDNPQTLQMAMEQVQPVATEKGVRVLWSGSISQGLVSRIASAMEAMIQQGACALTDDGYGVSQRELMEKAFQLSEKYGIPVLQHAEMSGHGGVLAPGPVQQQLQVRPYPASSEFEMVARDLQILQQYPQARYHVLHVSCQETLMLVDEAKQAGMKVTCEASPHHLYFCNQDIDLHNPAFKMNPPLRSAADRLALQNALASGVCDFVATDHAPHEAEVKTHFNSAAFGTTGLETSLSVLLTLRKQGVLCHKRLVEVFSTAPARFLGLEKEGFGHIDRGLPLRAVLIDPESYFQVTPEVLKSKSQNNCFLGTGLFGKPMTTFLGERIYHLYE